MMHKLYSLHTKQRRETRCVFYLFTTPNYSKNSMYMYMHAVHGRPQQEVKKQIISKSGRSSGTSACTGLGHY